MLLNLFEGLFVLFSFIQPVFNFTGFSFILTLVVDNIKHSLIYPQYFICLHFTIIFLPCPYFSNKYYFQINGYFEKTKFSEII